MKTAKFLSYVLLIGLLFALAGSAGLGLAQGPEPPEGAVQPQGGVSIAAATVSSKFSYQGVLKENGSPVTGSRDMTFRLYSDNACSAQVGGNIVKSGVPVTNGLFSVDLNVPQSAFNGQALWLAVYVNGTRIGCQEILPVPYALSLRPGANIAGNTTSILAVENQNSANYSKGIYSFVSAGSGLTFGVYGQSASTTGRGVYGWTTATTGNTYGVYGRSDSTASSGVFGWAHAASGTTFGVYGKSDSTAGHGVHGYASAASGVTYGVYGQSASTQGRGVTGYASASTGTTYGVVGGNESTAGRGVYGWAHATTGTTYGVYGEAKSPSGYGGYFKNTATSTSGKAYGVYGLASATSGLAYGVYGESASTAGRGVYGTSPYIGVDGYASATSGYTRGVDGRSDSTDGRGVVGWATATSGTTFGVYGEAKSPSGYGGYFVNRATSGPTYGVYGEVHSPDGYAGYFRNTGTDPSANAYGVLGVSDGSSGKGVYGVGYIGVEGSGGEIGVYGYSQFRYAGYFDGNVWVNGDLGATGSKSFKIDHPLDPANKYLYHFAQESPEVQNVYNGVVTLDANGEAAVTLPAYFSALNTGPYRYQLTPIGAAMPNLYIAEEIQGNTFRIAGGVPGKKVSWEVTAVRNDPYLRDHPVQTEQDKPADEQGTYLYPEGYGQPPEKGLDYQRNTDLLNVPDGQ